MTSTCETKPTTSDFLALLFGGQDYIEFRCIETYVDEGKKKSVNVRSMWTASNEWQICEADTIKTLTALNHDKNANIFLGVCPRSEKGKGKSADIRTVRCLWSDIDNVSVGEAKGRIMAAKLPFPNIVINSGHGVHLYWVLTSPLPITCEADRRRVEAVLKRLNTAVGGDHVQDLARILRLPHPDLHNVKNARNGQSSTPVELIRCESEPRITIEEMEAILPVPSVSSPSASASVSPTATGDDHAHRNGDGHHRKVMPQEVRDIISRLAMPTDDRSSIDFHVLCELIKQGVNKWDAWSLVENRSKFAERGVSYFDNTWDKAVTTATTSDNVVHEFSAPANPSQRIPFPVDVLPQPMRDVVKEVTRVYGGDPAAAATWAIATLSASVGNLARIRQAAIDIPTHLYTVFIGESGSGKTICGKAITQAIQDYQIQARQDFQQRRLAVRASLKTITAQMNGLQAAIHQSTIKGDQAKVDELSARIHDLENKRQDIEDKLRGGAWVVDDITPEKLLCLMAKTYDRAAFLASEAKGVQHILGLSYGNGSSVSLALNAWDGVVLHRDRMGDSKEKDIYAASEMVRSPSLTIVATYTPTLFEEILKNRDFRSSGFLSRCLLVSLSPVRRVFNSEGVNKRITYEWDRLITSLAKIPVPQTTNGIVSPHAIGLTADAYNLYVERAQARGDEAFANRKQYSDDLSAWHQRYAQQALRVSALIHFVRHRKDYVEHDIGVEDVKAAFDVMDYYADQFRYLMDEREQHTENENVSRLMAWAMRHGAFRKKDANDGVRPVGDGTKAKLITDAIYDAQSRGWIILAEDGKYAVSPEYHTFTNGKAAG